MQPNRKILNEICFALTQLDDMLEYRDGTEIVLYPDFKYLFPHIFRQQKQRYRLTDIIGSCLLELNDRFAKPKNVSLSLSIPTCFELIFALKKYKGYMIEHTNDPDFSSYVYQCLQDLQRGKIDFYDINSEKVRNFLMRSSSMSGLGDRLGRFLGSIKTGHLDMLTDHYSTERFNEIMKSKSHVLESIRNNMERDRSLEDDRDHISRHMSYKADSLNIFLPVLNEIYPSTKFDFICSNRFHSWSAIDERLQEHQKSPLVAIILFGNYSILDDSLQEEERLDQVHKQVKEAIDEGRILIELCNKYKNLDLKDYHKVRSFINENFTVFFEMVRNKLDIDSKSSKEFRDAAGLGVSYNDYLEIVDGVKHSVSSAASDLGALLDDSSDDLYRDFVDDERLRAALLKHTP